MTCGGHLKLLRRLSTVFGRCGTVDGAALCFGSTAAPHGMRGGLWLALIFALSGCLLACSGAPSPWLLATSASTSPTAPACPADHPPAGRPQPVDLEAERRSYPEATAATWAEDALWTANESGRLTRWNIAQGTYEPHRLPNGAVVRALSAADGRLVAGATDGMLWLLAADGWHSARACAATAVTSIAPGPDNTFWCACAGEGLVQVVIRAHTADRKFIPILNDTHNATSDISAVVYDRSRATVWAATRTGALWRYDPYHQKWTEHLSLSGHPAISALLAEPDGSVWAATSQGVHVYRDGTVRPCTAAFKTPAHWLARADGRIWVAGDNYIARLDGCDASPLLYTDTDNPVLHDRHRLVVADAAGRLWFIGRRGKIRFDGTAWVAIDADVRRQAHFVPVEPERTIIPPPHTFPPPRASYVDWLRTWPRPSGDNGRGMHFLQTHQYDAIEAQRQINRLVWLDIKWATVVYRDHDQLRRTAPLFQAAGITAIWRPFVRPYQAYLSWAEDVAFLRQRGIAPYMQLYNEPELEQEWDDICSVNQELYLRMLLPAVRQVYDAGGYVGLQLMTPEWLRATLRALKAAEMPHIFARMFFIPHLHGLNHPPDYTEDIHGVLGFRAFAQVFAEEVGFVPMMVAGEGGWRLGERQDNRFPAISEELHRDYHLEVFDWFRTGRLSDGTPLPDYLFAFCPWLLSDPVDPAAWFDSASGDRRLTIEAVAAMPPFERRFTWDEAE